MSTAQALSLKVWDSTGSVTGPGLSSRQNKQHHISVALCSGVFLLLNCCILQQLRHHGLFSLQFSSCKHQGELTTMQRHSTVKARALLQLPATELVTDSVPTVIVKTMVTSGIFHFQGCQALSSAPHQWWWEIKAPPQGCLKAAENAWSTPALDDSACTCPQPC